MNPVDGVQAVVLGDADRARLTELCAACSDFFDLVEGQPGGEATAAELLGPIEAAYSHGAHHVWGFERDGRLVGVAELLGGHPAATAWYIGLLILRPAERRRGLGRKLVDELRAWIAARGGTVVRVVVQEQNPRARAFWEREGFALEREVVKKTGLLEGRVAILTWLIRRPGPQ